MAELILDTRIHESWAIAARLDAILAYPHAKPKRLDAVVTARCSAQIAETIRVYPDLRRSLVERYPAFIPSRNRTSILNMDRGRKNALRAGAVFLAMIKGSATGAPLILNGQPVTPTLDLLVPYYWSDERAPEDPDDSFSEWIHSIEQREVRRRYPVAHLCAAFQWLARRRAHEGEDDKYDYQDLDFSREWVSLAQEMHRHIQRTPGCASIASALIDLQWIE